MVSKVGNDTGPVFVCTAQPDYLFEMFFLVFFVMFLLLQNYNIYYDVRDPPPPPPHAAAAVAG